MFISNPKDPDVTDRYGFDMDTDWLDGEPIVSVDVSVSVESGLLVSDIVTTEQPRISFLLSNGNEGFWPINIRVVTPTRSYEGCLTLWVKQGC